jgi:uncharacterized protein
MFVNLTDVFNNEGKVVSMQTETELTQVSVGGEFFQVVSKSPIRFTFSNIGKGRARIEGEGDITLAMRCDRCLKPVEEKLSLLFNREVFAPDTVGGTSDALDDQQFMDGYQLNMEDLLTNEIVINWPMKVLCKPDCKGICRQCGQDLNTGTCGCDTFVPDPRMAVIKDIFDASKEV